MPLTFQDITWANGQNNDAGLATEHYYAMLDDILTFPTPGATPADPAAAVTVTTDFAFKSGKCWKKLYCTLEKGELASTMVGSRDCHSYENVATLFHPGNKAYLLGWLEMVKNSNIVMLVRELEGQLRIIGAKDLPAFLEQGNTTTGSKVSDEKGASIQVKSLGRIAPVYTGTIALTPAA